MIVRIGVCLNKLFEKLQRFLCWMNTPSRNRIFVDTVMIFIIKCRLFSFNTGNRNFPTIC